jgi:3-hydroxy-3-methylglutaryl CoA synthase
MSDQIKVNEVMGFLRPNGWAVWDNDLSTAQYFDGVEPISEEEYAQGLKDLIAFRAKQEAEAQAAKEAAIAKLAALGLDLDDLKSLGF